MLLLDDILLFPITGILWTFSKLHEAVLQEMDSEAEDITVQLSELYMMLETVKITEEEFDAREKELLDRLDQIQERDANF
ncbi:MAG: gas vesicle protein GvpG [Syntrophobacteraceae bacterium]